MTLSRLRHCRASACPPAVPRVVYVCHDQVSEDLEADEPVQVMGMEVGEMHQAEAL